MTSAVETPFKPHRTVFRDPIFKTGPTREHEGKCICVAMIFGEQSHTTQCWSAGKVQDAGGNWWCNIHSPEGDAKRQAAKDERDRQERMKWAARAARHEEAAAQRALADRALEAIRQIAAGHNDPRSLAEEVLASGPPHPKS